jgi:hypothetical protein
MSEQLDLLGFPSRLKTVSANRLRHEQFSRCMHYRIEKYKLEWEFNLHASVTIKTIKDHYILRQVYYLKLGFRKIINYRDTKLMN